MVLPSALTVPQVSESPKSVAARCRKGRICLAGVEGAYGGGLGRKGFSEPRPRLPQVWGSHWTGIAAAWVPRAQTIPRWGPDGVCLYWQARGFCATCLASTITLCLLPLWKDTRHQRGLLPLAGRQGVPGPSSTSGVQSVVPPLCTRRPRVRMGLALPNTQPSGLAFRGAQWPTHRSLGPGPGDPPPTSGSALEAPPAAHGRAATSRSGGAGVCVWVS